MKLLDMQETMKLMTCAAIETPNYEAPFDAPVKAKVIDNFTDDSALSVLLRARDAVGFNKYGVHLSAFNGRDALVDGMQEALDGIAYATQRIEELEQEDAHGFDVREEQQDVNAALIAFTQAAGLLMRASLRRTFKEVQA